MDLEKSPIRKRKVPDNSQTPSTEHTPSDSSLAKKQNKAYLPKEENINALENIRKTYPKLLDNISELTDEQWQAIEASLDNNDVFMVIPTGAGKSLSFQLQPLFQDVLHPLDVPHVTIVISPLLALIEEQVAKLNCAGIQAINHTKDNAVSKETQFVFVTPEFICTEKFKTGLRDFRDRVSLIALDECHCITLWGKSFRKKYRKITFLASCVDAPWLFLTGTATPFIRDDIYNMFTLDEPVVITKSADRPNIKLVVKQEARSPTKALQGLVDDLLLQGRNHKKTVVFCGTSLEASDLYEFVHDQLDEADMTYINKEPYVEDRIIEMYHSTVGEDILQRVRDEFPKPNSVIRVLFSTVKLGMGVSIDDIELVILYGLPDSMLELWQEVGRAGRGQGSEGNAIIYSFSRTRSSALPEIMCPLTRHNGCYRAKILDQISVDDSKFEPNHERCSVSCRCCNFCEEKCPSLRQYTHVQLEQ